MINTLVLKIGGSLIYNDDLRVNELFLFKLKTWFTKYAKSIDRVVIVVGGGKLSRQVGRSVNGIVDNESIHDISMQITQVNAEILKGSLSGWHISSAQTLREATDIILKNPRFILISGGLKKGWSTDMDAAVFADLLKVDRVYKLSNIEGVYTADPKLDKTATFIESITWDEYNRLFDIHENSFQKPNQSAPISPETAIFCKSKKLTYYVSGGKNIYETDDLANVFESGTVIRP